MKRSAKNVVLKRRLYIGLSTMIILALLMHIHRHWEEEEFVDVTLHLII